MTAESHPRGFRHVRKVRETGRSAARSAGGLGRARRVGLGGSGGGFAGAALAGAAWRKRGASKRASSLGDGGSWSFEANAPPNANETSLTWAILRKDSTTAAITGWEPEPWPNLGFRVYSCAPNARMGLLIVERGASWRGNISSCRCSYGRRRGPPEPKPKPVQRATAKLRVSVTVAAARAASRAVGSARRSRGRRWV